MTRRDRPEIRLERVVEQAFHSLSSVEDSQASRTPSAGGWSAKEVIGHLTDSAVNNHPRFVNAALSPDLVGHGYDQEAWVRVQRYQDRDWTGLLSAWRHANLALAGTMAAIPEKHRARLRERHNLHRIAWRLVPEDEPTTLEYLMQDYVDHLEHHLEQIRQALAEAGE